MRSFPSSSGSNSSSSYSLAQTSLNNRLDTIFKKAYELCTLCEIEVCVIYYGPDGEPLKTWPEDREKVRDIALRYSQLNETQRHKKSVDLYGFLNKKNDKEMNHLKKKAKTTSFKNVNELKYPISDNYSADQISQLIQSFESKLSTLQERLRLVESLRQKDTKLDHQSFNSMPLNYQDQTQFLKPSQFSLFMYNHEDATLSQIPLSASNFNQDFSALIQESGLTNQLMNQELYGFHQNLCMSDFTKNNFELSSVSDIQDYSAFSVVQESGFVNQLIEKGLYGCDENMCLGNINSNDFQHPFVSNTEHYSVAQESVNNDELSQLIRYELWDYDQNMLTSDITNNNVPDPYSQAHSFR